MRDCLTDYGECYNENLADDWNGGNLNANGKYHCSVVGPMIFPLKDLSPVVPATLHIMLGIVLLLYNLLVDDCKKLDRLEGEEQVREKLIELSEEWELASLEFSYS